MMDVTDRRSVQVMAAGILLAGCAIGFGNAAHGITADGWVSVLVSTQRLTPWYWGNDHRFGMLVPLLASWCKSPVANLAVQSAINASAGLAAFYLVAAYVFRGSARTGYIGTWSACIFVLLVDRKLLGDYLLVQPYGVSMALGVGAMVLLDMPRWWSLAVALPLLVLGFWVNGGLGLVLLPLWFARALVMRDGLHWHVHSLGIVLALQWLMAVYLHGVSAEPRYLGLVPAEQWGASLDTAWRNLAQAAGVEWVLAIAILWAFAYRTHVVNALHLFAVALLCLVPVALNVWVADNLYAARYFLPTLVLIQVATMAALGAGWRPTPMGKGEMLGPFTLVNDIAVPDVVRGLALFSVALCVFSNGGRREATAALMELAPRAQQVDAAGCTGVYGGYWEMWPTVAAVAQLRYDRGDATPIYARGVRGEATAGLPHAMDKVCALGAR